MDRPKQGGRMGLSRFATANLRLARFCPGDLDNYVASEFISYLGAANSGPRRGKRATADAFMRRLHRMAVVMQHKSLHHLLVWYVLEYKGRENAKAWQARLAAIFGDEPVKRHPQAIEHLEQLVEMVDRTGRFSIAVVAGSAGCNSDSVARHMRELAGSARLTYSARWMVFLYALHKELQARPELTQVPVDAGATQ